jgi:hypothetical protein
MRVNHCPETLTRTKPRHPTTNTKRTQITHVRALNTLPPRTNTHTHTHIHVRARYLPENTAICTAQLIVPVSGQLEAGGLLVRVQNCRIAVVSILAEPPTLMHVKPHRLLGGVVLNHSLAKVIDPHTTDDDVVHCGANAVPADVVATLLEVDMRTALR